MTPPDFEAQAREMARLREWARRANEEIAGLRSALAEACDRWEDAANYSAHPDSEEDQEGIARLRSLLPDPKMHWREDAK